MLKYSRVIGIIYILLFVNLIGQSKKTTIWDNENFAGLKLRSIGPAFMSGRISDVVVHPDDENTWYLAVGSGNVWKTSGKCLKCLNLLRRLKIN